MKHIRPWQFFGDASGRVAHISIPCRRAAGGLMTLETICLISAIKQIKARTVFEFGTLLGGTTLNLAMNLPEGGTVYTFDLSPEEAAKISQHPEDVPFTSAHLSSRMDFEGTPYESCITRIAGNSLSFNPPSELIGTCDFVFIDGGHDLATAIADTKNAMKLTHDGGMIFWHDYRGRYPELTEFLDTIEGAFHIEDTLLCGLDRQGFSF